MKKILVFIAFLTATISFNAQSLNGKTFVIQSMGPEANKRVIDADGYTLGKNGTKVQLWDKNGSSHQNWTFVSANKGVNSYYIISAAPKAGNFKYLDASYANLGKNGGIVMLWQSNRNAAGNGEPNQLWKVTKNSDDSYRIQSMHPKAKGACLDADGITQNRNGGKIQMWQYTNNKNQAWKLISTVKTYKIGDRHPDGGIVFKVNSEGTHGAIIWSDNTQKFSYAEANAKVASLGKGWQLPSQRWLSDYRTNLSLKNITKFTDFYYWANGKDNQQFANYVRMGDGYKHYGPVGNKFNICLIKNF